MAIRSGAIFLGAFVGGAGWLLPATAGAVNFRLSQVADLSPASGSRLAFGDTDHDGQNEVVLNRRDETFNFSYRVFENQGNNVYVEQYRGAPLYPAAIADLDGDGKAEIIGQQGAHVQVYESPDSMSHPSQLVWSSPNLSTTIGPTFVADTDRDGRMEILHEASWGLFSARFIVFENTGDNAFEEVFSIITQGGSMVVADLDGDGLIEVTSCGYSPPVNEAAFVVFESPANDTWVQTFMDSTGMDYGGASTGGLDSDGNGSRELFLQGTYSDGVTEYWMTVVYEAIGDNQFAKVATLMATDGSGGSGGNALGNVDGVGREEYLLEGGNRLWIHRAMAPGQWVLIDEVLDPTGIQVGVQLFDANKNGREEIFWPTSGATATTIVLEHDQVPPSATDEGPRLRGGRLSIVPNPCRLLANLRVPEPVQGAARLAIYDVSGRLVERSVLTRDEHERFRWAAQRYAPGIYLLRIESKDGAVLAAGRAVVIR
jgi:hypothetical protein